MFQIIRFYQDDRPNEVMALTFATVEEARKYCSSPYTCGPGWFDGYTWVPDGQ
jgi:hypothetical protein